MTLSMTEFGCLKNSDIAISELQCLNFPDNQIQSAKVNLRFIRVANDQLEVLIISNFGKPLQSFISELVC